MRTALAVILAVCLAGAAQVASAASTSPIDRPSLVARHSPRLTGVSWGSPLSVGNGGFAFTVDATGLQTFGAQSHAGGFPLETLARWGWLHEENAEGYSLDAASRDYRQADGTLLRLPSEGASPAGQWFRRNPRLQPLFELGFCGADGRTLSPEDIGEARQELDLWRGVIRSEFVVAHRRLAVTTRVDAETDTIAVSVRTEGDAPPPVALRLRFPRGHDPAVKNTPALDWAAEGHGTTRTGSHVLQRSLPGLRYRVMTSQVVPPQTAPHEFVFPIASGDWNFRLQCTADETTSADFPEMESLVSRTELFWARFWQQSAALDLSGSTNPRATELERRVVLSQYLTAIQSVGDTPPQESGLACNTWYGKHHTEMIWWHTAHFALWGHPEWLARNLGWYVRALPVARQLARERGLQGARWPKMTGPEGRESPGVNPLIVWNQPHPIYLAELLYRANPTNATLQSYAPLVEETAECLATMAKWDPVTQRFVLGPPVFIAQEIHDPAACQNPGFELTYLHWALGLAQHWRERAGLPRRADWDRVRALLARPAVREGKYVAVESIPDTWSNRASQHDHPQMLMGLGFLPDNELTNRGIMAETFSAVLRDWDWETKIWGWDYPMMAMTGLRLNRPEVALQWLLSDGPNNRFLANGHCPQRSDEKQSGPGRPARPEIAAYLPANGALLATVAMMLAGWDGADEELPGFPKDGSWCVRAEGWSRLP